MTETTMERINIMIAEDHTVFREALIEDLDTDRIKVLGGACNGIELVNMIKIQIPDVVVLDLKMPEMNGNEVLKFFKKQYPNIRTIIYSYDYSTYLAAETIRNGASAYLTKDANIPELIRAIEGVHSEGFYFNELISKEILQLLRDDKKLYTLIEDKKFSEREVQIIKLLCDEVPIAQIADRLNISTHTVKHHKHNVFLKTESITIVSLVKFAIKHGIVT